MGVTMIIGTISSKGQVTVPKKIREFLQVGTYDKIVFIPLEDGNVLITGKRNPAKALLGMMAHRGFKKPVSIEEMNNAIKQRRVKRGEN
jgi:antitoxin PrlF